MSSEWLRLTYINILNHNCKYIKLSKNLNLQANENYQCLLYVLIISAKISIHIQPKSNVNNSIFNSYDYDFKSTSMFLPSNCVPGERERLVSAAGAEHCVPVPVRPAMVPVRQPKVFYQLEVCWHGVQTAENAGNEGQVSWAKEAPWVQGILVLVYYQCFPSLNIMWVTRLLLS